MLAGAEGIHPCSICHAVRFWSEPQRPPFCRPLYRPHCLPQAAAATSATAAWDLRDLFPTDAAWEAERQSILAAIPASESLSGQARRRRASLKAALQAQSDLNRRASRLYTYASLKADEDRRVAANQERKQQAQDVFTALGEATAWSSPEIVALGRGAGERADRGRPGTQQIRIRPARYPAPGAAHLVAGRGAAARLGRHAARRAAGHSRPARLVRHSAADREAQRRQGDPARRPGLYARRGARPTAPTARWSSTNIGRATRRSRIRSARRSRPRPRATCSRPRRAITTARCRPRSTAPTCPKRSIAR